MLAPAIAGAAGLANTFVGPFNAGVWAAALAGTLAAPLLLARFDAWTLSRSCMLLCAAGVAAVASGHVAGLALGAVLIGLGHGLEGPMASHLLATHVAPPRRALWFSVKQTGVQVGAVAASFSLPLLASLAGGWRAAALVVVLLALAAAVLLALPARRHAVPLAARPAAGAWGALSQLRSVPVLRSLSLAAAAFGAMQVVLNGFFVSYAVSEHGASLVHRPQRGWVKPRPEGWSGGSCGAGLPVSSASSCRSFWRWA